MNKEIWKTIENLNEEYQISNFGNVRHIKQNGIKILKSHKDKSGYLIINIYANNKNHSLKIHRLVANAFVPNPNSKEQVNHIDFNRINNRADNLEWCTLQENIQHSKRHGKYFNRDNSKKYKKINQYDLEGNLIKSWDSILEAGRSLNLDTSAITKVCKHKPHHNTCGGYIWEYKG